MQNAKKSPSAHRRTTLLGYIFTTKTCIDKWQKLVKQQYLLHTSLQYRELQPTNCWHRLASLGHPRKFQRVSRLGFIIFTIWSTAFNRGHHVHSAGLLSHWALAHIVVLNTFWMFLFFQCGDVVGANSADQNSSVISRICMCYTVGHKKGANLFFVCNFVKNQQISFYC